MDHLTASEDFCKEDFYRINYEILIDLFYGLDPDSEGAAV